jgi:hypothetical protein
MPGHYTDVEKLLLQRWADVQSLMQAYNELQGSMEEVIGEAAEQLEKWAAEKGYEFSFNARAAEFYIWKDSWANRRGEDGVCLAVGGIAPAGYRKSDTEHPYLWVYAKPAHLRIRSGLHEEFSKELLHCAGDDKSWLDPDTDDDGPLGKTLTNYTDTDRLHWMSAPSHLVEFATSAFEQLIPLTERIDKVVRRYRA